MFSRQTVNRQGSRLVCSGCLARILLYGEIQQHTQLSSTWPLAGAWFYPHSAYMHAITRGHFARYESPFFFSVVSAPTCCRKKHPMIDFDGVWKTSLKGSKRSFLPLQRPTVRLTPTLGSEMLQQYNRMLLWQLWSEPRCHVSRFVFGSTPQLYMIWRPNEVFVGKKKNNNSSAGVSLTHPFLVSSFF